jgi:DNA-binding FrmR family transcriptional regulator
VKRSVKKAVVNRLGYAIGHLDGIRTMIKDGADPLAILQQTRAVSSLLRSIDSLLLSSYLQETAQAALDATSKRRLNKALKTLVDIYTYGHPRHP